MLLEIIDYIDDSASKILNQYNDDVKIKDFRAHWLLAVEKLQLYIAVNEASTVVSGEHNHKYFDLY